MFKASANTVYMCFYSSRLCSFLPQTPVFSRCSNSYWTTLHRLQTDKRFSYLIYYLSLISRLSHKFTSPWPPWCQFFFCFAQAAQNLVVISREDAGAEQIFRNDGVKLLQKLLESQQEDIVLSALRTLVGLCTGHQSRVRCNSVQSWQLHTTLLKSIRAKDNLQVSAEGAYANPFLLTDSGHCEWSGHGQAMYHPGLCGFGCVSVSLSPASGHVWGSHPGYE